MSKASLIKVVLVISVCFLWANNVYAFNFERDVAAKCRWTKAYKKAHPEPKNNMPKTMQEYYRAVNKAAGKNQQIPSPKFEKDNKLVDLPDPELVVQKYNSPPGLYEINLNPLKKTRHVNSIGVASPKVDKMAFSSVFYYPSTQTAASELYLMNLDTGKNIQNRMEDAHINQGKKVIYRSQMEALDLNIQKTLTILDWSEDNTKLAFKEKTSFSPEGLWKTSLLIYNTETNQVKDLSEVRSAIEYYWRQHKIYLKDSRWDIYPIGWDAQNPDRIIVFAYAATGAKPMYLGAWSIDYQGNRSMLLSLTETKFEVSQNGYCLKTE